MNQSLAKDELRIWIISLARLAMGCDWEMLDCIERQRADAFSSAEDRSRFIIAHASVRSILSKHTGIAARHLQFRSGLRGKPYVDMGERRKRIRFNLSHSGDLAVLALQSETEVGVDVERIQPIPDVEAIARNYFHPEESAWLDRLSNEQHLLRFLALWTMKEACIKAWGVGLVQPLDSFCVVGASRQSELVIEPLVLPAGYCGSVAYRPPTLRVTMAQFVSRCPDAQRDTDCATVVAAAKNVRCKSGRAQARRAKE